MKWLHQVANVIFKYSHTQDLKTWIEESNHFLKVLADMISEENEDLSDKDKEEEEETFDTSSRSHSSFSQETEYLDISPMQPTDKKKRIHQVVSFLCFTLLNLQKASDKSIARNRFGMFLLFSINLLVFNHL